MKLSTNDIKAVYEDRFQQLLEQIGVYDRVVSGNKNTHKLRFRVRKFVRK